MEKIAREAYKNCPFLSSTPIKTLKKMSFSSSALLDKAFGCPVLGVALKTQSITSNISKNQAVQARNTLENNKPLSYEAFFSQELDKKKQDKSYRYFNNINRLAKHFPKAETGEGENVTVWCSNDYLGMSRHPLVIDSMQYFLLTIEKH